MNKPELTVCLKFPELFDKPTVAIFNEKTGSSDGGAVLLKAADKKLGIIGIFSEAISEMRQPEKIVHRLDEIISQRVFGIACGYEDCNDASKIGNDPIHKMLAGREALAGDALASQPTLSRLENSVTWKDIYRISIGLMNTIVQFHQKRLKGKAKLITIDLDPTDDPTHGAQQLTFFNAHYDTYCYLPMVGFLTFNNESEQYLFTSVLRPGNVNAAVGAIGILRRVIAQLGDAFPKAKLRIRLDGGFATPEIFDYLDSERVEYLINMAKNNVLKGYAEELMEKVRLLSEESSRTEHLYGENLYCANTWKNERRAIFKAEVVRLSGREPKDNPRFVITNMKQSPQYIYEKIYCQRGDVENRIKELHHGLSFDRTSCESFKANQFRILLTAASYILMQEIRRAAAGTSLARAQVSTLQILLIKLGARVFCSLRRNVIYLPESFVHLKAFHQIAFNLGASTA